MGKVIAVANQKGGVAKSTTATALATGLAKMNYKTLLIDTDPQCNASDTYQAQIEGTATLFDLMCKGEDAMNAIQTTDVGEIIAGDPLLSCAENQLNKTGKEFILKKVAAPLVSLYDYIIIDTPPALGVLLTNALTFANTVIVPVTADRYSLQGLSQLEETISAVKEYTNPGLTVAGLLLTKYNERTRLSKSVFGEMPQIAEHLNTCVFDTKIRESTSAKEAQTMRQGLFSYNASCTTAVDYINFAKELIEKGV